MPCCSMLCHAVPCNAVPCNAIPCHPVPCHAMLYNAMPSRAIPCHTVPCRATPPAPGCARGAAPAAPLLLGTLCNRHLAAGRRRLLLLNYALIPLPLMKLQPPGLRALGTAAPAPLRGEGGGGGDAGWAQLCARGPRAAPPPPGPPPASRLPAHVRGDGDRPPREPPALLSALRPPRRLRARSAVRGQSPLGGGGGVGAAVR